MSEMWQRDQKTDGRSDGRSDHGTAGANKDPASGTGCKRGRKGSPEAPGAGKESGYVRVRIDGNMYELSEEIKLDKNIKHNIEIVVDRLVVKEGIEKRLTDSIENVLNLAEG